MKIAFFSAKPYDKTFFNRYNEAYGFELEFWETHLGPHIVNAITPGTEAVCVFVNDKLTGEVIDIMAAKGVKIIALRCAGFNNVDLERAKKQGIRICRVPAYSPEAVAEHAVAMLLTLNRKTHKAYNRVREQNFSLNGLLGFNLYGRTTGVIGTGKIGKAFIKIMLGFGCKVLACDLYEDETLKAEGVQYLSFDEVLNQSDILSLHCPLNAENHYLINESSIVKTKKGVTIINTSRGGLLNTHDVIQALKSGHIAYLGIDVYEQEEQLFFKDLSGSIIANDEIQRLMSFPNVLVTGHQAFFTEEALSQIATITLNSIDHLIKGSAPADPSVLLV
ncbi:2-hydroxyacid dehydrogenase [Pedobacter heparinus]|uniref:D-isomer specific 2-hydroxyacid dehydrogenase NAD-binding n=1 Tax=Pedobacter heparinus (strain ATCC 13125 / DSM 2366 / CIP 104194 / JCM 7457 / NBRC 12017 / NCIMB 9290 / NRRL B-14731 / HIM 762-3) TaxID=485917 RepID=C6XUN9_PEDHD|nr:2-hydroxyacid dehydrogenase [Pedobacter heparinus]ACU03889.1 D-isomer specific 2-hydroxyacid dehydrogenase NAD-binding [Pedobacter heparinus DSM 2366]